MWNDHSPEASPAPPRGFLREGEDPSRRIYLRPLRTPGGSPSGAPGCEVLVRLGGGVSTFTAVTDRILEWARAEGDHAGAYVGGLVARLRTTPPPFAGLDPARPLIMGIINVTPDSFSDGGETPDAASAIARGQAMLEAGADILDVGGESARPGARPVPLSEELARVLPVVRALAAAGAVVSIDSRHAGVMRAAREAGAAIINDITALAGDAGAMVAAAMCRAPVILMHMQGEPATMQGDPRYAYAPLDVYDFLAGRVAACEGAGIPRSRIAVDPGIGFGKTADHNVQILSRLSLFHGLGCVVALGVSRKSFIARLGRGEPVKGRLGGSLAAALAAVAEGVHVLRVHDVAETRQALEIWAAVTGR